MQQKTPLFPASLLQDWFIQHQHNRELPWRNNPSPYQVWISEVMLQQTRASVVIPYFDRWMARFPTIHDLASAPIEDVIKLWEGLGYYSRARNLHQAAKFLVEHHQGVLPSDPNLLIQIKGLGPYTVGAIRSFAFHHKAAAVDGNVIRVLSRFFAITQDVAKPSTIKTIWELAEAILPNDKPWLVTEGLIELGASLCGKNPACHQCPLRNDCSARKQGPQFASSLPFKSKKEKITPLHRLVLLIHSQDHFLVSQVEEGKIMAGLYEFPYIESDSPKPNHNLADNFFKLHSIRYDITQTLDPISHTFTRYKATLYPIVCEITSKNPIPNYEWVHRSDLSALPFSSGHRKLFSQAGNPLRSPP